MNSKPKKPFQNDKIFVKSKAQQKKSTSMDDIGILALQISCPYRTEIKVEDLSAEPTELGSFYCVNIESRSTSSIVFIGTYDDVEIEDVIKKLQDQMLNIIKSANEKIYFLDIIKIEIEPLPFVEMLAHFAEYTFLWQLPKADIVVGYVKLEKKKDEERFQAISMDNMEDEKIETDVYLHFPKNNRYVHYLKKGNKLDKTRKERLSQRGVKHLYSPADQSVDRQKGRVLVKIAELLRKLAETKHVA